MPEIPESSTLAKQLIQTVAGKRIARVNANHTPHKFAWYFGDPNAYSNLLSGAQITGASAAGSIWNCLFRVETPCPVLRSAIRKETYLGGSVYYCENCQKLDTK